MSILRHSQEKQVRTIPPTVKEIFGEHEFSDVELGMLQMQMLWLINNRPRHGYELMKDLNAIKKTKIGQGTLYPTLQKMEKQKLIKGEEKEKRIVYHITEKGKRVMGDACTDFSKTFFGIFQDYVCNKCVH